MGESANITSSIQGVILDKPESAMHTGKTEKSRNNNTSLYLMAILFLTTKLALSDPLHGIFKYAKSQRDAIKMS
jgi:hypothetical protein